jgi:hypothetical protein
MEFIQLNELQLNKMDDHYMKLKRIFDALFIESTIRIILMKLLSKRLSLVKNAVDSWVARKVSLWLQDYQEVFP